MRNFFTGLLTIFCGGFIAYIVRLVTPEMITGTDAGSIIATYAWPIAIFFIILALGFLVMIGRKRTSKR